MGMPKGQRVLHGAVSASEYPGFLKQEDGGFRQLTFWKGKPQNLYYVERPCEQCNALFLRHKSNDKRSPVALCSPKCRATYKRQALAGKTYQKHRDGGGHHVLVMRPDHPRASRRTGTVAEHLVVAEAKYGREIKHPEIVHHINCVKSDNRPGNLVICRDATQHFRAHGSLNRCVDQLLKAGVLRFDEDTMEYQTCF